MSKAVFLDRDGTLIEYLPYLNSPNDVRIIKGVDQALRILRRNNYRLIVITNQAGVAHGLFREEAIHKVHRRMIQLLTERGCELDAIYYCPHHPYGRSSNYRRRCKCRKPEVGLLQKAACSYNLDLNNCYMIGDTLIDVLTGLHSGGTGCLVMTGIGERNFKEFPGIPWAFPTLLSAARWIIKRRGSSIEDSDGCAYRKMV